MSEDKKEVDLVIKFANQESLRQFALWLCESGEQSYWDWMEYREDELDEDDETEITARSFHYHGEEDKTKAKTDPERYKEFMCDNTIRTTPGRLRRSR